MTNVDEIFDSIAANGQHPRMYSDTYIMLEQVGHRLDRESERLFNEAMRAGLTGTDITYYIEDHINLANVLRTSAPLWDGGYVFCGVTGSGEMFAMRDPWGIRPAFWYKDDEIMVLASERPVIQTTLDLDADKVHELKAGEAIFVNKAGDMHTEQIIEAKTTKPVHSNASISAAAATATSTANARSWDACSCRPYLTLSTAISTTLYSRSFPIRPKPRSTAWRQGWTTT